MKTSHECNCAPDVKTGTESKSKHTRCTCHLSFPEKEWLWFFQVHNALCSTTSFCMAWTTLKDYIYPLTISQMKWFEMKLPNLTKKKNIVAASNLPPHFLLHLNAATDAFMLWWWNSYNAHTVQELRQTSRVLLNFNRKTLKHLKYPVIFTWGSVINKLWVSDPPNSPWKHRRGNQGAGP